MEDAVQRAKLKKEVTICTNCLWWQPTPPPPPPPPPPPKTYDGTSNVFLLRHTDLAGKVDDNCAYETNDNGQVHIAKQS